MPLTIKDDKQSTEMNTEAVYDIAFKKGFNFSLPIRIVGLPVSIEISGIFGDINLTKINFFI